MATVTLANLAGHLRRGFDAALRNTHMFDEMGASLLASVRQGIQAETAPDGTAWKPLAKATVKKRGSANPILRDKGRLYKNITYRHRADHARVGVKMPQARILQHGGTVRHPAGERVLHFRRTRNGQMRFSRANRRAKYGMKIQRGAYNITIPARPYLYNNDGSVPTAWKDPLVAILVRRLTSALGAICPA